MCRAVMYGGMEETYGIRVLYSGLESRRYMSVSSCQFLLFSPTVSAYEDLHVSTSTGEKGPCVRMTNKVRGVSRLNDTEKNSMDRRKDDMHESRNVVKFFFVSSGISQWPRQVPSGPPAHPPVWGARRPELVQPAGATVALHEHSEVYAALNG